MAEESLDRSGVTALGQHLEVLERFGRHPRGVVEALEGGPRQQQGAVAQTGVELADRVLEEQGRLDGAG